MAIESFKLSGTNDAPTLLSSSSKGLCKKKKTLVWLLNFLTSTQQVSTEQSLFQPRPTEVEMVVVG